MSGSKLRVVVIDKTNLGNTGPCQITKTKAIIRSPGTGAISKYHTRPWFSARAEALTPSQANHQLTFSGQLRYEKIFILIIYLEQGERARFKGDDEALSQVMRAATIEAMQAVARAIKADYLNWIARPHPDYPLPCVKVLMNRYVGTEDTEWQLKMFPRQIRTHWLKQEQRDDPRVAVSGGCGEAFLRVFDQAVRERQ